MCFYAGLVEIKVKIPYRIGKYRLRFSKPQVHMFVPYTSERRRAFIRGERHPIRKKKGYGGQEHFLRLLSKTTGKQTLESECKVWGYTRSREDIGSQEVGH